MAKPLARISGVAIRPGVSRNARLYTRENIAKLVERASSRIGGGDSPITMRTHHGAGDDSTRIVGRVTRIWQDDTGAARYEGEIADAGHGPTIAGLLPTSENDTSAALRGVSIRGRWASPPRRTTAEDGQDVETADDLEIDGLDFTASPGVAGAHAVVVTAHEVPNVPPAAPNSGKSWESEVEHGIVEAAPDAEILETATAETDPAPTEPVPFADRGDYLSDRRPRFPLDTRENAERAWLALRRDDTARRYTAAQLKRVRGRVTKALTEFGVYADSSSGWLVASPTRVVSEGYLDDSPGFGGAYRISLTNGPTTVSVCCYQLDPHDLDAVGRAAMSGALAAIKAIDPDLDADIDIGSGTGAESAPPAVENAPADPEPTPPTAPQEPMTPEPSSSEDEPVAEEPNTPTAGTAPAATAATGSEPDHIDRLTDMIGKLITAMTPAAPAAEAAPAMPVAETAPAAPAAPVAPAPVAETEDQRIARLVQEQVTARVQDLVESGQLGAGRKGLTGTAPAGAPQAQGGGDVNEHGLPSSWPNKPLHEYSDAEFSRYAVPQLENYVLNGRVPRT